MNRRSLVLSAFLGAVLAHASTLSAQGSLDSVPVGPAAVAQAVPSTSQFQIRMEFVEVAPDLNQQVKAILDAARDPNRIPQPEFENGEMSRADVVNAETLAKFEKAISESPLTKTVVRPNIITTSGRPATVAFESAKTDSQLSVSVECTVTDLPGDQLKVSLMLNEAIADNPDTGFGVKNATHHQIATAMKRGQKMIVSLQERQNQFGPDLPRQYVIIDIEEQSQVTRPVVIVEEERSPAKLNYRDGNIDLIMELARPEFLDFADKIKAVEGHSAEIVKVTPVNPNRVMFDPQKPGQTNLQLTAENGQIYHVALRVSEPSSEFEMIIKKLFPTAKIEMTPLKNSVFLRGTVTNPEEIEQITAIAEDYHPSVHNFIKVIGPSTVGSYGPTQTTVVTIPIHGGDTVPTGLRAGTLVDIQTYPHEPTSADGTPQVKGLFRALRIHTSQNQNGAIALLVSPEQKEWLERVRPTHRFEFKVDVNGPFPTYSPALGTPPSDAVVPYQPMVPQLVPNVPQYAPPSPLQSRPLFSQPDPIRQPQPPAYLPQDPTPVPNSVVPTPENGPQGQIPLPPGSGAPTVGPEVKAHPDAPFDRGPDEFNPPVPQPITEPMSNLVPSSSSAGVIRNEIQALRDDVRRLIQILEQRAAASTQKEQEEPLVPKQGEAVLFFTADWCLPCQTMMTLFEKLARENANVRIIDIDRHPELATEFHVTEVPTLIRVKDGEPIHGQVHTGILTEEQLCDFVTGPSGNVNPLSGSSANPLSDPELTSKFADPLIPVSPPAEPAPNFEPSVPRY